MKKFIDLLIEQYKLPAAHRSSWATSQLENRLSGSTLNAWHLGDPVSPASKRILIGIAVWSAYDLRLLDALDQAFVDKPSAHERIDIFELDAEGRTSGGYEYIEQVIPGLGRIYHTPIVGIWESSKLTKKDSGAAARELIIERYNLNRDDITPKK